MTHFLRSETSRDSIAPSRAIVASLQACIGRTLSMRSVVATIADLTASCRSSATSERPSSFSAAVIAAYITGCGVGHLLLCASGKAIPYGELDTKTKTALTPRKRPLISSFVFRWLPFLMAPETTRFRSRVTVRNGLRGYKATCWVTPPRLVTLTQRPRGAPNVCILF